MRSAFATALEKLAAERDDFVFLTGDLGFNALEGLRDVMGERFINCGVAEQNMVGVAAGMAMEGFKVFCYSIAPFITLRPLEQVRNDICLHRLPVFLVGNGGGYGYGIMGSSHHAPEDIALMRSMPNMHLYLPAFRQDLEFMLNRMLGNGSPAYLRLGLGHDHTPANRQEAMVCLHQSESQRITAVFAGNLVNELLLNPGFEHVKTFTDVWVMKEFPYSLSPSFLNALKAGSRLLVAEEHYAAGGLGESLINQMALKGIFPTAYIHRHALGYPSGTYGSQQFHRKECGLDGDSLVQSLQTL
jgi:transketolase